MTDNSQIILDFESDTEFCEHCHVPEEKLEETNFDLIIIGGGAAGFSVATLASELNLRVAMINDGLPIGGTCANVGCVPSKILIEMGNKYYYSQLPPYTSLQDKCVCAEQIDLQKAVAEKDQMIDMFRDQNYIKVAEQFTNVTQIKGRARFISPTKVEVNNKILQSDKFIITTGSRPHIIPFKGLENVEEYYEAGLYKYTSGSSKDFSYANDVLLKQIQDAGYKDSFVVVFMSNRRISLEKAFEILNKE